MSPAPPATTTTIQISTVNRDALLRLGRIMQAKHPAIWDRMPSYNAAIGYALTNDLGAVLDEILPMGE
jgi:hypothetical protein